MTKLHLGCGKRYMPGWINIDLMLQDNIVDVLPKGEWACYDISKINSIYEKNSIDEIYICHCLEHLERQVGDHRYENIHKFLQKCYQILKPGGILRISIPDFCAISALYQTGTTLYDLFGLLYGGAKSELDFHTCCFDYLTMKTLAYDVGFINIEKYNPVDFLSSIGMATGLPQGGGMDDYSLAKINDTYISLNVLLYK